MSLQAVMRSTRIRTPDGVFVLVPNSTLIDGTVKNLLLDALMEPYRVNAAYLEAIASAGAHAGIVMPAPAYDNQRALAGGGGAGFSEPAQGFLVERAVPAVGAGMCAVHAAARLMPPQGTRDLSRQALWTPRRARLRAGGG